MPDADANWKPKHNPWAVALTVTLATFMEVLDTSIANVAIPHIAGGLGASQDEATWVLTSYLVSNAVILPASAYLVSFIGRKRFYMICVAMFGISSMLCGLAPSLPLLIFFRVLQGAGGGGLQPSEQAILADTFPPRKRGQAFAVYGMAVVLAPAIGPTLGGWITDNYTWRWIFFINVPIAILSLFLTYRLVEDPPHIQREVEADREAASSSTTWDSACSRSASAPWSSSSTRARKTTGSARTSSPSSSSFPPSRSSPSSSGRCADPRGIAPSSISPCSSTEPSPSRFLLMFVLGFTLFGTTVLIPLFVQEMMGYTAEQAGLVISPGGVCIVLMPLVGILVGRVDPRYLIA